MVLVILPLNVMKIKHLIYFFTKAAFYHAIKSDTCIFCKNKKYRGFSLNGMKGKTCNCSIEKEKSDCIGFFGVMFSSDVF